MRLWPLRPYCMSCSDAMQSTQSVPRRGVPSRDTGLTQHLCKLPDDSQTRASKQAWLQRRGAPRATWQLRCYAQQRSTSTTTSGGASLLQRHLAALQEHPSRYASLSRHRSGATRRSIAHHPCQQGCQRCSGHGCGSSGGPHLG